ncbi:MAG: S1 RNA-binding domain-containing protein [Bacilli bacterium]
MAEYAKNKIVKGTVTGVEKYGVFVSLGDYDSGLIHISEASRYFINNINDLFKVGDEINVQMIGFNEKTGHFDLSVKNIEYKKVAKKRRKIIETSLGFRTLAYKLPIWIDESLKKLQKETK